MMSVVLSWLGELSEPQLVILIAVAAGLVAILVDWRLEILAQLLLSLCIGLLLASSVPPQLAMLVPLSTALACLVLYWTGRRLAPILERSGRGSVAMDRGDQDDGVVTLPFRILAFLFWALVIATLSRRFPLPQIPPVLNIAAYWVVGMALLTIILTRNPFKTGLGLLSFSNAVLALYMLFDPSLLVLGLLGVSSILMALVASYLTVARHSDVLEAPNPVPEPSSREAFVRAVQTLYYTPPLGREVQEQREELLVP